MTTFPPTLPKPETGSYSVQVNTSVARTKFDSGRVRQRKRFTRDFRTMPVSWSFSDEEYGLFQSYYRYALNSGADWFYLNLALGDGIKQYRCRFIADTYTAKYDGFMYWKVTARVETEDESSPVSQDEISVLAEFNYDIAAFEAAVEDLGAITQL